MKVLEIDRVYGECRLCDGKIERRRGVNCIEMTLESGESRLLCWSCTQNVVRGWAHATFAFLFGGEDFYDEEE